MALDMPNPFQRPDRGARLRVVPARTMPSNPFQQKPFEQRLALGLPSSRYSLSGAIWTSPDVRSASLRGNALF
jgi:hypothetical protein